MTKTLTEQWRDGTLPDGKYYIKLELNFTERYDIDYSEGGDFVLYNIEDIEEVLAPVPDYMDCKRLRYDRIELDKAKIKIYELVSKTEQLEKRLEVSEKEHYRTLEQLRIAAIALKETKEKLLHVELSGLDGDNRQKMYDLMFEDGVIDKALKEMKDVK